MFTTSTNNYMVLVLIYTTIFVSTITTITAGAQSKPFVTKLIHRDSVHSPFYDPSITIATQAERSMNNSIGRFAYLQQKIERSTTSEFRVDLFANSPRFFSFLMNFSLGQPPVQQLTIMDTASDLLWVKCNFGSEESGKIYDPVKSTTYADLPCNRQYCNYNIRGRCNRVNQCAYSQRYIDGPQSDGVLATEQVTFQTSDEGIISVPGVVFGCGHTIKNFDDKGLSGISGIGGDSPSLVNQLGHKFSYCIGNLRDPYYTYNHLIIGDAAILEGDSTPLEVKDGLYHVRVEGISIGENMLDILPDTFNRIGSGVVIDSGSEATWLPTSAFDVLRNEVSSLLDQSLTRYAVPSGKLCYKGDMSKDLVGFPLVAFHFAGGAELGLDTGSLFYQSTTNVFCMGVYPTPPNQEFSLIGINAQQYYNVGYDIIGNKLYLQRMDCELLVD